LKWLLFDTPNDSILLIKSSQKENAIKDIYVGKSKKILGNKKITHGCTKIKAFGIQTHFMFLLNTGLANQMIAHSPYT